MAVTYQIFLSNGTFLAAIPEDSVNNTATSIDLFGRGLTEYGERLQNNIVHILENFAGTSQPDNPLTGQLWYDSTVGTIKVFNGVNFVDLKQVPNGTITNETISVNAAIDLAKLAKGGSPAQIIVTDGANFAQYVDMTGDVTIDKKGITTIVKDITVGVTGAVSGSTTQSNLDSFDIATTLSNGVVDSANLVDGAVTETKLGASSVIEDKLQSDSVSTNKIQDQAVTLAKMAASSIDSNKIITGSIDSTHLASAAVTSSAIANGAIESQHFSNSSISSVAIQDGAITTDKIADGNVTADKLAANSVTLDKIAESGTAQEDYVLTVKSGALEFTQFGGSLLSDFTIEEQKLFPAFLTPDYGALVAIPFSTEVTSQDLAKTQTINIDYGSII